MFIDKFLTKKYRQAVKEYGIKLESKETTNDKDQEACHLAKLILHNETEVRINSLKSLAEVNSDVLIPLVLREINLLTKKRPDERTCQLLRMLYVILCRNQELDIE